MENTNNTGSVNPHIVDRILAYKTPILAAIILLFVAGLGYAIMEHLNHKKEYNASKDYFLLSQSWKQSADDLQQNNLATVLENEENRAALETFIKEHNNTSTAMSVAVNLSDYYTQKGELQKALDVLNLNDVNSTKDFVNALYAFRIAMANEKLGQCEAALSDFNKIINNKTASFLHADARLQKALCLEQLGRLDEAKVEYENITKNFGDTEAGRNAKKYLHLLNIGA